jgi:hypothetical protein
MSAPLLNVADYTPLELSLFGLSSVFWVTVYALVIRDSRRLAFVGMPAFAFCGNIAWEFLYGFVYQTNLGTLAAWGMKVYFPLNCYIGWQLLRHGHAQFSLEAVRRHLAAILAFAVAAWLVFFFFFIPAVDDPLGMSSANVLNVVMSALFIQLLLHQSERKGAAGLAKLSYTIAWCKMLGTAFSSLFCALHFPERRWMLAICSVTFVLDVAYVVLFTRLRAAARREQTAPATGVTPAPAALPQTGT